jgi:methylthioribose-1-phosphate isomerase
MYGANSFPMSSVPTPLFEPVRWNGQSFSILDELQLPEKIEYIDIGEVGQAVEAVRQMRTRAFGQVLAFLYSAALVAQKQPDHQDANALRRNLAVMERQFCAARPTFDFAGLGALIEERLERAALGTDPRECVLKGARDVVREIVAARLARARLAAETLPSPARILTHCNVSGELVAVAQACEALGKEFSVIATETRPYLQGTRLTAWELARAGVAVSVIPDCAAAQMIDKGNVNAVLVGSDRCARNGDVINKIGTYPLAIVAKEGGVPFYALVQKPRSLACGSDVAIEERPESELMTYQGEPLLPPFAAKVSGRYPAFDVTPAALMTGLIGFDAVYTPTSFRATYRTERLHRPQDALGRARYVLIYGLPSSEQHVFLARALTSNSAAAVLVPEMRPELWGARVVAPALARENLPVTLIGDSMMGAFFAAGEICKLVLFYENEADAGARSLCGALLAARLARYHGVEVQFLQGRKRDGAFLDRDVSTMLGRIVCPDGVHVPQLGEEVVPWSLLNEQQT